MKNAHFWSAIHDMAEGPESLSRITLEAPCADQDMDYIETILVVRPNYVL